MSFISAGLDSKRLISSSQLSLIPENFSPDGFIVEPRGLSKPIFPEYFDTVWNYRDLEKPKKPSIIGSFDISSVVACPWIFNVGTFVIKEPGSSQVFIPKELEVILPFVQKCVDNEFAASQRTLGRRALLMFHSTNPEIGSAHIPHGAKLHGHPPIVSTKRFRANKENPAGMLNTHYYVFATRDPTLFYTGEIDYKDTNNDGFEVKSGNYKSDFQSSVGEIVLFTSVHAHESPHQAYQAESPRVFANLMFEDAHSNADPKRPNNMLGAIRIASANEGGRQVAALMDRWRQNTASKLVL